jgi:uncharacterized membrane protein YbhN (UPF0104 family)
MLVGILVLAWVLWRADLDRLQHVVAQADIRFILAVPLAIAVEQLVRAWKWRQLLHAIRPVGTLRLFGAIMVGYFAILLIPLGASPLVRSWLIGRLESLKMSSVLATAVIDRLVDGVIFTGFVAVALVFSAFPDPGGGIRLGLMIGGVGSLALFALLLFGLARYKLWAVHPGRWVARLAARLPARLRGPINRIALSFAEGIVWPREAWRGVGVVLASVTMKLIAITHFLWAGLAFGIVLRPWDYLFLVVFLGFLIILTRLARIPGGFFLGAIFALDLLGVAEEPALAMVVTVQLSTVLTVAAVGALALWRSGVALDELRLAKGASVGGS